MPELLFLPSFVRPKRPKSKRGINFFPQVPVLPNNWLKISQHLIHNCLVFRKIFWENRSRFSSWHQKIDEPKVPDVANSHIFFGLRILFFKKKPLAVFIRSTSKSTSFCLQFFLLLLVAYFKVWKKNYSIRGAFFFFRTSFANFITTENLNEQAFQPSISDLADL